MPDNPPYRPPWTACHHRYPLSMASTGRTGPLSPCKARCPTPSMQDAAPIGPTGVAPSGSLPITRARPNSGELHVQPRAGERLGVRLDQESLSRRHKQGFVSPQAACQAACPRAGMEGKQSHRTTAHKGGEDEQEVKSISSAVPGRVLAAISASLLGAATTTYPAKTDLKDHSPPASLNNCKRQENQHASGPDL